MNGRRHPPQPHGRVVVTVPLDRRGVAAAEGAAGIEQAGVEEVQDRPQLVQPVLDRRARERDPVAGRQRAGRLRAARERVLDLLRLVQHQHPPLRLAQQPPVARQQRVGGQHHVVAGQIIDVMRAVGPVVEVHRQVGSEPPQLASPVAEHRCRAHDQRRRIRLVGAIQQIGDQLHRLAQTHVVGQQRAQAQPAHAHQPAQSALLVGPQHAVEPLAGLDRLAQPRVAQLSGQLLELRRARRIDLHVEPAQLGPPRQRRSQSRQRRDAGRVQRQLRQLPRPPQRLVAKQRPLAADAHQRLGGGGQGTELLVADLPAAQSGVQVVLDDAAQRQRPGCERQPSVLQLQLLLLAELGGEAHRCARELERGNGRPQVGDLRQRQLDAAVLDPGQRRQDVGGAADPARVYRRDVQGPVAARIRGQLQNQLQRIERAAQVHHRRDRAQVGRDGAQRRLQHREIDRLVVAVGGGQLPRVAHRGGKRPHRGAHELLDGGHRADGRGLLAVIGHGGVRQRREGGREPIQRGRIATRLDHALGQPGHQPPGAQRCAGLVAVLGLLRLGQQVRERRQHRQTARVHDPLAAGRHDRHRQPAQVVGQPAVVEQRAPATRCQG